MNPSVILQFMIVLVSITLLILSLLRKIPNRIAKVYLINCFICLFGWELWMTYGILDGQSEQKRMGTSFNPLLNMSIMTAGDGLIGVLQVEATLKAFGPDAFKKWNWEAFTMIFGIGVIQNVIITYILRKRFTDKISYAPLMPWRPKEPILGLSPNIIQIQEGWILQPFIFYLLLIHYHSKILDISDEEKPSKEKVKSASTDTDSNEQPPKDGKPSADYGEPNSNEELQKYHDDEYPHLENSELHREIADMIEFKYGNSSVIDVGCMNGNVLQHFQNLDYYTGLEISDKYAKQAQLVGDEKSFPVTIYAGTENGLMENPKPPKQHYDCIYFGGVLEFIVHENRTTNKSLLSIDNPHDRLKWILDLYTELYSPKYIILMSPDTWQPLSGEGIIDIEGKYGNLISNYGTVVYNKVKTYSDIDSQPQRRIGVIKCH